MTKIAFITGSRADFGLLLPVINELSTDKDFEVEVWATGMHLAEEFGNTLETIIESGHNVPVKVPCLEKADTPAAISRSVGRGVMGWSEVFEKNEPDLLIVLGDRFEILAAVESALFFQIPVAHLCGGDVTLGAFDECIRHSLTKMSHLHFVTNSEAQKRVIQLGENPEHVFAVGSPAIDLMQEMPLMEKEELSNILSIQFSKRNFLITYHPVTLTRGDVREAMILQIENLLDALKTFENTSFFFTKTNADSYFTPINERIEEFCQTYDNAYFFDSLGQKRYWSLLSFSDVIVGNSSSGLYEAPSFKKPTVNIGDRQKGRLMATSVLQCQPETQEIVGTIERALTLDCSNTVNPYGQGGTSRKIKEALKKIEDFSSLIPKNFFDLS